jgi:hypothetical protein
MNTWVNNCPFGFRILGECSERRRLVTWAAAFRAYAGCDEQAQVDREAYLSAFTFGRDFAGHLESTGSTKGFAGACWAPFIWFDIDRDDLDAARLDAGRLAVNIGERFNLGDDETLIFFSGSKGFHLGLPTQLWRPEPANDFNRTARRFAEVLADAAAAPIDTGVYDKVRAFRAPNSRHAKTGLHKRRLSLDEVLQLSVEGIRQLAVKPEPFDVPEPAGENATLLAAWRDAERWVKEQAETKVRRQAEGNGAPRLNRLTLDFIANGAETGDRHRLLFSAAANLAEFNCPSALAYALLTEAGLDSGLPPAEVRRQIDCGLEHGRGAGT